VDVGADVVVAVKSYCTCFNFCSTWLCKNLSCRENFIGDLRGMKRLGLLLNLVF
jgi:hypothetical protein